MPYNKTCSKHHSALRLQISKAGKLLSSLSAVTAFLVLSVCSANSQTINKYILLHRKGAPEVKSSKLASGYDHGLTAEFSYEPIPTEAMKKRVEIAIPPRFEPEAENYQTKNANVIFLELSQEAEEAIARQPLATETFHERPAVKKLIIPQIGPQAQNGPIEENSTDSESEGIVIKKDSTVKTSTPESDMDAQKENQ